MTNAIDKAPEARRPLEGPAAALFTLAGLAAGFGVASCCALPLMLAALGAGSAWLGGVALLASPHRDALLLLGALSLLAGADLLWRQQRKAATCGADGACAPPAVRALTLAGLLIGAGFLWAGYAYA